MDDSSFLGYIGYALGILIGCWLFLTMVYLTVSAVGRAWYNAKREEQK
jgi:hypothetical protein